MSFTPATSYPTGASPQAIATADFNNDGKLDLVTANTGGSSVSVLLGDGQGGFAAARYFATATHPRSVAVADFNNDGNLDLATITDGGMSNKLSVLPGNGDGTFQARVDTNIWSGPLSAAAGDFNADGNMDLVYTFVEGTSGQGWVDVRIGDGHGGFAASYEHELHPDTYPVGLAVADLNADGRPDVVTNGSVLLGNGDGTLSYDWSSSSSNFATDSRSVAIGDFTGEGVPDLVTAGQTVDVLPGLGDGTFAAPIPHSNYGTELTTVAAADFDGDGNLDVVTAAPGAGTVSVLLGRGDGTLSSPIDHAAGSSPIAVAVGDFNGDARPDVAAADWGSNAVSIFLNDGAWSLPAAPPPTPPPSVSVSDATVTEGNTGTANATFTLTLSHAAAVDVTVHYGTQDITAAAGSDYTAAPGTVTIPAGQTSRMFTIAVQGDRLAEPTETFAVNLSAAENATIGDSQGIGTILDNEPRISINNVSRYEGRRGKTTLFTFTVTLSAAYDQAVTMSFRTVNGTATTGDNDYGAKTGTLTFKPGERTKTITIVVKGDSKREPNETFYLDLFGASSNSLISAARGTGTILDDDSR